MMYKTMIHLVLILCATLSFGQGVQLKTEGDFKKRFDGADSLDSIEGIWILNVVNTLFDKEGRILGQSFEEARSSWAILRISKSRFRVYDIGSPGKNPSKFKAYFEKDLRTNQLTYTCKFKKPRWKATTNVLMNDDWSLDYEYFVSDVGLKSISKLQHDAGYRLYWRFIWTKKYPSY